MTLPYFSDRYIYIQLDHKLAVFTIDSIQDLFTPTCCCYYLIKVNFSTYVCVKPLIGLFYTLSQSQRSLCAPFVTKVLKLMGKHCRFKIQLAHAVRKTHWRGVRMNYKFYQRAKTRLCWIWSGANKLKINFTQPVGLEKRVVQPRRVITLGFGHQLNPAAAHIGKKPLCRKKVMDVTHPPTLIPTLTFCQRLLQPS
jgi:hypothetical protein